MADERERPANDDPWYRGGADEEEAERAAGQAHTAASRAAFENMGVDMMRVTSTHSQQADRELEEIRERNRKGCIPSPTVIGLILVVGAAAIAAVAALGGGSGDELDERTGTTTATGSSAPSASTAATADGSDVSAFAGHYELTAGLDNPNGHDTQVLAPGAYEITVEPASASFDVDESGTITGGEIHTSFVGVGDPGTCTFSLDGAEASGVLALVGPGASGQVTWTGEVTTEGPCSTGVPQPATRIYQLGIVGTDVVLCTVAMGADLVSCSDDDPRVAARFTRR